MKDELVSFEVAKLAKELSFNEPCNYYYVNSVFNTFKKEHGILKEFQAQDEHGDKIGLYSRKNSKGQPHIIIAPTQSLLQRWLREVHSLYVLVDMNINREYYAKLFNNTEAFQYTDSTFKKYEEALEVGLMKGLKSI